MKGKFINAVVDINYFFERRNGWVKKLGSVVSSEQLEKALPLLCPPSTQTLVAKEIKGKFFKDKELKVSSSIPDAELLTGDIDRVEIKIFYKEI